MAETPRFIAEPIAAIFDVEPLLTKKPPCPDAFVWREETFHVKQLLSAWRDYRRRGRFARNMQPQHLEVASQRGSWGVGRFYFRVQTDGGRVFDLYFDRAPKSADVRHGGWILFREWIDVPDTPRR